MELVLASGSPRRRRLLEEAGFRFEVRVPRVEESREGPPEEFVVRNASAKAEAVAGEFDGTIIGADTVVVCGGEVLGKPRDIDDARRMVELQLRSPQEVITGVCVMDGSSGRRCTGFEISSVVMEGGPDAVDKHLETGQWAGKAGAYGIQDNGPLRARVTVGSEDNVVGLPMTLVRRLLSLAGFEYPEMTPAGSDK